MTTLTLPQALENIYASINNDNADIDTHIAGLKATLIASGTIEVVIDPTRLALNNRSGRKMMQSYFKKRGITVNFQS